MKTTTLTALAACALALSSAATSPDVTWMGNVELSAVNRAKIVEKHGDYFLEVELALCNKGTETLKLRKGIFAMTLEARRPASEDEQTQEATTTSGQKQPAKKTTAAKDKTDKQETKVETIEVGEAVIDEVELPGTNGSKKPGAITKVVTIYLGPANDKATTQKAMRLLNAIGLPSNAITVQFHGVAEIGMKVPHGWVFELGKRYELDLQYAPSVQRRVPFI